MKKSTLYLLWGIFYSICAALGFIQEPQGMVRALLFLAAALFFVPPAVLLYHGKHQNDPAALRLVRRLSAASLGLTLVMLIGSILSALGSSQAGDAMHILLGLVSVPMFCSNYWAASLFGWAMLLVASLAGKKK